MNSMLNYNRIENWITRCLARGKMSFSLKEVKQEFVNDSAITIKFGLNRLVQKQKVFSIFKGYYLIIPPQYSSKGILPAAMFIDGLMNYLQRNYYVGLLNAAAFHGASHQQPQEYFIVTEYPPLRSTNKKGIKINYISTKKLPPAKLIEKKKTETGYINISIPLLTALDLVSYEKKIGGLNRASTVIKELLEIVKRNDVSEELIHYASVSSMQRLGFLLDEILNRKDIADIIHKLCKKAELKFYLIPLKASGKKSKEVINEKWKVMINTEIETDF